MASIETERKGQTSTRPAEKPSSIERPSTEPSTRDPRAEKGTLPSLMRRLSDDMDRIFGGLFGTTRWVERPFDIGDLRGWPEIEVHRRDDKLVVRADVPGLSREDVTVEIRDNELSISGERRHESEHTEGDYYRTERSYGTFSRTIPLPEGAIADTASASFQNGVLEIEIDVPAQTPRGRRIEVRERPSH
jgi:HSP20 family protein